MKRTTGVAAAAMLLTWMPAPAPASDLSPSLVTAARCATRASTEPDPTTAFRIIGSQDSIPRTLFGARDLVVIDAGTSRGVAVNQLFVIHHRNGFVSGPRLGIHAVGTSGGLRIVAANDKTSIGLVEIACDGIVTGDYLEAYVESPLPPNVDIADTSGELDFTTPAHVLFGDREQVTGAQGDFMVIDAGLGRGAEPGARFAIYRDTHQAGVPIAAVGEAVVIYADADSAVVRVTLSRDAIQRGDLLIPRRAR